MSHHSQIHSSPHCFFRRAIVCGLHILALVVLLVQANALVYARHPSEHTGHSTAAAQDEQEIRLLEFGKPPIEREMSGGQAHKYRFPLIAGQYAHVVVDQRGIDVLVKLFGPDGKEIIEVDTTSRDGTQGPEDVHAVAEISGEYLLEVSSLEKTAKPGRYEVRIEELRAASQKDRDRLHAEQAMREAETWRSKGDAHSLRNAAAKYEEAAQLWGAIGETLIEGDTLYIIGYIYSALRNPQRALANYEKARPLLLQNKHYPILGVTLNDLGRIYASLNYPERALDNYNDALHLFQSQNMRPEEATTFNNIGSVYDSMGKNEEAFSQYNDALTIMRKYKDHPGLPTVLNNIGRLYYSMGNQQKALDHFNEALPIFRTMQGNEKLPFAARLESLAGEATTLSNIGQVKGAQGKNDEALENYNRALLIFQKLEDSSDVVGTLGNIGTLYESLDRKHEALDAYLKAIDRLESLRASVTIEEIRAGIANSLAFVYKASLLHRSMGQDAQAFNLTELARARSFLDQVGNMRPDLFQMTDEQLVKDRQELESKITSLEREIERGDKSQPDTVKEFNAAQHLYEDLMVRYKSADPAYSSRRSVKTLSLPEVQRYLDKDTTLLSYFMGPDETLAFVITQGSFHAVKIPFKDATLIDEISWFRRFPTLHTREKQEKPSTTTLKQLYDQLIGPVSPYLKTRTICIIPHRELHFLPFAALTDGLHYLGAEHTLFYLPSASALPYILKRKPVGTRMLVLAQSRAAGWTLPLHYADAEATTVARLYHTQAMTTGTTSKSEFLKRAEKYDLIHIAAHAQQDTVSPLFYSISLGADKDGTEKLEVREIYNLDLSRTSLVVLSGCQTDWGVPTQGDDIITLNRAFLYAGTPTVIASLWLVDDKPTNELMASFYKHLMSGMGKAEALRAAQSDTRRKYPDPFYWASFVLTGDPGQTIPQRTVPRQ